MTDTPLRECGAGCGRPVTEPAVICTPCLTRTHHNVTHLLDVLLPELEVTLTKMARFVEQNGGRSTRPSDWSLIGGRYLDSLTPHELGKIDLAYARSASNSLATIRRVAIRWNTELNAWLPPLNDVSLPALLDRLASGMQHLATHPDAGRLVTGIAAEVEEATKVIDAPQNRLRMHVGPCPEQITVQLQNDVERTEECPGQVTATVPADDRVRPSMRCGYCRKTWLPEQWAHVGDLILRKAKAA